MTTSSETETYRRVRHPWLVQATVGVATIVTTFDSSSVNVALHTISLEFGVEAGSVAWLSTLAFLIVTSTLLLFGRLSDVLGAKSVFVAGFVVFGAGSLAAALAPSFPLLLLARGVQALGVSMVSANALAILTESFPPQKRGVAVGVFSSVVGLGYLAGPVAAGQIIQVAGWRYVFLALVPIGVVGLIANLIVLPSSVRHGGRRFDFPGAIVFALAATTLLLGISAARSSSLGDPLVLGLLCTAVACVAGFIVIERRVAQPMLQLALFRNRLFSFSLLSAFLIFVGITGQELLVPLFIQGILRETPATAGVVLAIVPLMRMVLSSPAGMLTDRLGPRVLTTFGAAATALGIAGLTVVDAGTSLAWIGVCLLAIGLGTGVFFSPNMHSIMSSVPPGALGVASGALGLRRNLGQSLGVGVTAYLLQTGSGGTQVTVPGFQLGFAFAAVVVALAAVLTFIGTSGAGRRAS